MSRRHPPATLPCHTPQKQLYIDRPAAETAARNVIDLYGPPMEPYRCACGWWHLTSHPRKEPDT